jgi:hypothetical protein
MPHSGVDPRVAASALLGLSEHATAQEITHAYRRLAKATHPDVTGPLNRDAASRFAALTAAYRLLLDAASTPPPSAGPAPSPSRPAPPSLWDVEGPRSAVPVPIRFTGPSIIVGPVRVSPLPRRPRR